MINHSTKTKEAANLKLKEINLNNGTIKKFVMKTIVTAGTARCLLRRKYGDKYIS